MNEDVAILKARIVELETTLAYALEGLEEMLPYVEEYFIKKWGLDGYARRAREVLDKSK